MPETEILVTQSMSFQDDYDNGTLATEASDEESSMIFSPLDSQLSYYATQYAFEVVPTKDIKNPKRFKNKNNKSYNKNYGSPVGDDINTRHVSGKKIDKKHTQFALSAGMMLGVRECVGGVSSVAHEIDFDESTPRTLEEECLRVERVKIPPGAYFVSNYKAQLPYRYKFKAYAPHIFTRIRKYAGIDKQRFLHSICGNDAFIEFVSNAKSGQFFFYSHDGRYMIKTQTQEEKNFLRQILPHYYTHLKKNPHSFITHFYGMYRVRIPDLGKSVHFVIMKSVFNTTKEIHKIWDLKGSTLGRKAKRGDSVHKDLDFVGEKRKLCVGPKTKTEIMDQLKNDANFLAEMQIMDYSMLLGVHICTKAEMDFDDAKRRVLLMRTNTPMRRQQLCSNESNASTFKQFLDGAKEILGRKASLDLKPSKSEENSDSETEDDEIEKEVVKTKELEKPLAATRRVSIAETVRMVLSNLSGDPAPTRGPIPYSSRDDGGIVSSCGTDREIYFAGVIDILQLYNNRKWGETILRKAVGNPEKAISCVSPEVYAERFVDFIGSTME